MAKCIHCGKLVKEKDSDKLICKVLGAEMVQSTARANIHCDDFRKKSPKLTAKTR